MVGDVERRVQPERRERKQHREGDQPYDVERGVEERGKGFKTDYKRRRTGDMTAPEDERTSSSFPNSNAYDWHSRPSGPGRRYDESPGARKGDGRAPSFRTESRLSRASPRSSREELLPSTHGPSMTQSRNHSGDKSTTRRRRETVEASSRRTTPRDWHVRPEGGLNEPDGPPFVDGDIRKPGELSRPRPSRDVNRPFKRLPAIKRRGIARRRVCPFLLRVYVTVKGTMNDEEIQVYAWPSATVREIITLVKDVLPEARDPSIRLHMKLRSHKTSEVSEIGILSSTYQTNLDRRSLTSFGFRIGDIVAVELDTSNSASRAAALLHSEDGGVVHEEGDLPHADTGDEHESAGDGQSKNAPELPASPDSVLPN
eukprot:Blabericola_migrator_1__11347@NODE_670_length_6948_cov_250_381340_g488_i0_p3_GENE_NODE_670_length_6948_cov_250_381340_g488_i0NODE_670_length_6948_cov_250_381340_g488_i0_p3_ORF_typecomplete_len371_score29_21SAP18/PF06487_12/3_1e15_NODE_670_length_6948_cov_250_381340_g488_i01481260